MGSQSKTIGDQLRKQVATVVKATTLEIAANLRMPPDEGGTPVLTGHARANWIPSVGAPADQVVDGASDSGYGGGVAKLVAYQLEAGPVYVSNAAPYIAALNSGSSKQAPAMFVEAAVDRALVTMQQRYGTAAIPVEQFQDTVGAVGADNMAAAFSPFGEE